MATFYEEMAEVANELIEEFGVTVAVRQIVGGSIGPIDGEIVAATETDTDVKGIRKRYPLNLIDGTRITINDQLWILQNTVTPTMADQLVIGGVAHPLQEVTQLNPAGTNLVTFVRIRV